MFSRTTTYEDVEDVIISEAESVVIERPGDVFIEPGAVAGELRIVDIGDVFVKGSNYSPPAISRDTVISGGEVDISDCEDVVVEHGAVEGDLVLKHTVADVFTGNQLTVDIVDPDDIVFEEGARLADAEFSAVDAEDIRVERDGIEGDVVVEDGGDILQESERAVGTSGDVDGTPVLDVVDCEDLLVERDGIKGTLETKQCGDMFEDTDF